MLVLDNDNQQSIVQDGRRQKYGAAIKNSGNKFMDNNHGNPLYITSPLNKSKQESFSQTGKINLQGEGVIGEDNG